MKISQKRKKNNLSRIQEEDFADAIGGKRSTNSGAYKSIEGIGGSGFRGDVVEKDFCIECKMTSLKSISFKKEWLDRLVLGARPRGKKPLIHLKFEGTSMLNSGKWVMLEESDFLELYETFKKSR